MEEGLAISMNLLFVFFFKDHSFGGEENKMVGSVENRGAVDILSNNFVLKDVVVGEQFSPVVASNGHVNGGREEILLGRNVHTTCLAVTEPDANEEFTGDKEAYMASVLARYRKTLLERTKYHLGYL